MVICKKKMYIFTDQEKKRILGHLSKLWTSKEGKKIPNGAKIPRRHSLWNYWWTFSRSGGNPIPIFLTHSHSHCPNVYNPHCASVLLMIIITTRTTTTTKIGKEAKICNQYLKKSWLIETPVVQWIPLINNWKKQTVYVLKDTTGRTLLWHKWHFSTNNKENLTFSVQSLSQLPYRFRPLKNYIRNQ